MSRPYRQSVATAALMVLTVVPTLYVVWTSWAIRRPAHLREVEAELGRRLGLQVTIGSVRYPRPGEVVYRDVVLRQTELSGKGRTEVARADSVRLVRADREVSLETAGLSLSADTPREAMARVGSMLERSGGSAYDRVSLSAPTCDLDLGGGVAPYRLRELIGQLLDDRQAPTVRASYRVVAPGSSTRCELNLTRDRNAEPTRTTLAFKTMEGLPLPARVLDPFFDTKGWLGPEAKVEGALTLSQSGSKEWEAEFQGDLLEIDLAELIGRRFPTHTLQGKGRLAVASARWAERPGQGSGWVDVQGELTAGPGVIGAGLLRALTTEMKFRSTPRVARTVSGGQTDLDFRALALRFTMNPAGEIHVKGGLGNQYAEGVVVAGPSHPIAYAPQGAANVRGLIKTLFPVTATNHGTMIPLTGKSRLLLRLPMPPDLVSTPMGGN